MSIENQLTDKQLETDISSHTLNIFNHDDDEQYKQATQNADYHARYLELEELLEYAVENGKLDPPELAVNIKALKKTFFYTPPNTLTVDELCKAEAELEKLYVTVAQLVSPVSILTLRATSEKYPVGKHRYKLVALFMGNKSAAHNFFRQLTWVAVMLVTLMFIQLHLAHHNIEGMKTIEPFLYGAIGALIYLYKTVNNYYVDRTFDPNKLSAGWLRIFMGALTGWIAVQLFSQSLLDVTSAEDAKKVVTDVSRAGLGFLVGYSVDFFYRLLDRIINTVLPKVPDEPGTPPPTPKQMQVDSLLKQLRTATNDDERKAILDMLAKM